MGCCSRIINDIIPYVNNAMLAAILSLLIVILFVLLLHVYARWFLGQANTRRAMAQALGPARRGLAQSTTYTYDIMTSSSSSSICPTSNKGLDRKAVDAIPIFIYEIRSSSSSSSSSSTSEGQDSAKEKGEESTVEIEEMLECAICLSVFEEKEIGRSLPRCSHAFHVDCIDMWLHSHSTCPVCRAHVIIDLDHHHHHHHHRDQTVEIEDGDHDSDRDQTLVEIVAVENHDRSNNGGDDK